MKAFVEIIAGVVRAGENCEKYGDPFDYAVAFSSVDGKTAVIKALVTETGTGAPISPEAGLSLAHARAAFKALKELGLSVEWERMK